MLLATSEKEIILIHNSQDHIGRQILAYAQTENLPLREIDLLNERIPGSQWAEISDRLGLSVKDLINQDDPDFMNKFGKTDDLDDHDWLKLLEHNPDILRAPIVIRGNKFALMSNPQDMLHF